MRPHFPHDYDPGIAGEMPPGFSPTDFVVGSWFLDALGGSPNSVGEIAPAGYEAYVHLPHPYWAEVPPHTQGSFYDPPDSKAEPGYWSKPIRRSEVAQLRDALGNASSLGSAIDSAMGAPPLIHPLIDVLRTHTPKDMACLCGFWVVQLPTFGGMVTHRVKPAASSRPYSLGRYVKLAVRGLQARNRARRVRRDRIAAATAHGSSGQVLLYRGSLDGIEYWLSDFGPIKAHYHPPSVFWPEDRRWCVAMPQNKPLSIVAGTRLLVEDILALTDIDAFEVKRSDDVWDI